MSEGFVHSVEVGSFVDGPGMRFVVFLSGCPLRCAYCHNPDSWRCRPEQRRSAQSVVAEIARSAAFLKSGAGGVTVSGGEPLAQAEFAVEILRGAKELGLHTALDTSGFLGDRISDEQLDAVDLVLLDIKSWDPQTYREVTGVELEPTLRFATRLSVLEKCMWIRFVLVPGLTDDPENVAGLAAFLGRLSRVERVEVLPFHQMGRHKWDELGLSYRLEDARAPSSQEIERVKAAFEAQGLPVDEGRIGTCAPTNVSR